MFCAEVIWDDAMIQRLSSRNVCQKVLRSQRYLSMKQLNRTGLFLSTYQLARRHDTKTEKFREEFSEQNEWRRRRNFILRCCETREKCNLMRF